MPAPLPKELRERVVQAWIDGDTIADVAEAFDVGTATVKRWTRLHREKGTLEPAQRRYGPHAFATDDRMKLLLELLSERTDWTHEELAAAWGEACSTSVSASTAGRALRKLGYTRKKRRPTP